MEFRFDATLYSRSGNEISDAGHSRRSPTPVLKFKRVSWKRLAH